MAYNLTQVVGTGNETSMLTFVQGVNNVLLGGMLGAIFLGGITVVLLMTMYHTTKDWGVAFTSASFISFMLALPLVAMHLLSQSALILTAIAVFLGVIFTWGR